MVRLMSSNRRLGLELSTFGLVLDRQQRAFNFNEISLVPVGQVDRQVTFATFLNQAHEPPAEFLGKLLEMV